MSATPAQNCFGLFTFVGQVIPPNITFSALNNMVKGVELFLSSKIDSFFFENVGHLMSLILNFSFPLL